MGERARARLLDLLDRWRTISVVLLAVVAVDLTLYFAVIRASVRVSGDRESILRAEQQRLGQARAELDGLERTASKLACVESDVLHVFEDVLSSKSERMTAIQREIRTLAREKGLDPDRITYSATAVKETGLVRFQISIPLAGSYEVLEQFIQAVESSSNFLIVEDVTMDEDEGARLELRVKLVTYFQAPDLRALERAFPGLRSTTS